MADYISKLRSKAYNRRFSLADEGSSTTQEVRIYLHGLLAAVMTRGVVLGPLERCKMILQTTPICRYANPSDTPKSLGDLLNKINLNQGTFAYWRGFHATCLKLSVNYGFKFVFFDTLQQSIQSTFQASLLTAVAVTFLSYPLDVAQCRMATDMSKKPSMYQEGNSKKGVYLQ